MELQEFIIIIITTLFTLFHVGLYLHKFLSQSHFPPTVSSKEDVQRGARLLARRLQEITQPKTLTCLPATIVIVSLLAYQSRY